MGNLLSEIGKRVGDLVSHPVAITRDIIKNPKEGFKELGDLYTHNTHKDQDLFQKGLGIRGWVGDHPQETAAAVVATIFGGWAAAGSYGGAAGTAAGGAAAGSAAGSAAGGLSAAGATTAGTGAGVGASTGVGAGAAGTSAGAFTPAYLSSAYTGGTAAGTGATTAGTTGAVSGGLSSSAPIMGTSTAAYSSPAAASGAGSSAGIGNTSALLNMGNAGVNSSLSTGGASQFTPAMLTTQGASATGGTYGAASAPASSSSLGTVPAQVQGTPTQQPQQQQRRQQQQEEEKQQTAQLLQPKAGHFDYTATKDTAYNQAQQLLQQVLASTPYGQNPYSTTQFTRK